MEIHADIPNGPVDCGLFAVNPSSIRYAYKIVWFRQERRPQCETRGDTCWGMVDPKKHLEIKPLGPKACLAFGSSNSSLWSNLHFRPSAPLPAAPLRCRRWFPRVGPTDGSNHILTKHHGIAQRLLVEQQNHCATLASACCTKFQSVLAWLQRKPKDIEEVNYV